MLELSFPEDGHNQQIDRHNNHRADDTRVQLGHGEAQRAELYHARARRLAVRGAVEHGVGDHCAEEQRNAAGETLQTGEVTASGPRDHRIPQVVVSELLLHGLREQMLERDHVFLACVWKEPVHLAIAFLDRKPVVANEIRSFFLNVS